MARKATKQTVGRRRTHARASAPRKPRRATPIEPESASASVEEKPEDRGNRNMLKGFAEAATGVVARAASILEEEIAAGIVAAKKVENRFIDANTVRAGKPEEVLLRFRRDAHEVVDILLDLVFVATNAVGGITRSVIRISGDTPGAAARPPAAERSAMPTLSPVEAA